MTPEFQKHIQAISDSTKDPVKRNKEMEMENSNRDLPKEYTLTDYTNAPSGIGPLASEWSDKPHRLLYDLVSAMRYRESLKAHDNLGNLCFETTTVEEAFESRRN